MDGDCSGDSALTAHDSRVSISTPGYAWSCKACFSETKDRKTHTISLDLGLLTTSPFSSTIRLGLGLSLGLGSSLGFRSTLPALLSSGLAFGFGVAGGLGAFFLGRGSGLALTRGGRFLGDAAGGFGRLGWVGVRCVRCVGGGLGGLLKKFGVVLAAGTIVAVSRCRGQSSAAIKGVCWEVKVKRKGRDNLDEKG